MHAPAKSGEADPGLLIFDEGGSRAALPRFIEAIARHRHFERELDPPGVEPGTSAKAGADAVLREPFEKSLIQALRPGYSGLRPARLAIFCTVATSWTTNLSSSAGVVGAGSAPSERMVLTTSG